MNADGSFDFPHKECSPQDDQEIIKVLEQNNYTVSALRKILDFSQSRPLKTNNNESNADNTTTDDLHQNK